MLKPLVIFGQLFVLFFEFAGTLLGIDALCINGQKNRPDIGRKSVKIEVVQAIAHALYSNVICKKRTWVWRA